MYLMEILVFSSYIPLSGDSEVSLTVITRAAQNTYLG